ncbi:MAG: hypothetical protein PHI28_11830, partial [Mangrovibacterium sp.]|nr:hypothetical protein [Mangrovibacterium sp.]
MKKLKPDLPLQGNGKGAICCRPVPQPRPYIQAAGFTQGLNRYSYALNNPLVYIDQDGEFPLLFAIGALIGSYVGGAGFNDWEWNPGKWDFSDPSTYFGMVFGGLACGLGVQWMFGPESLEYYDQQGRVMRRVTTGFEGAVIYADTHYNLLGRVEEVSDPYFKVGGTLLWKEYEYDLSGRVTEVTLPGNRVTTTVYNGLTTTVTGPLNKTMSKTSDVLGNLVESRDHNLQTVTYDYFSSGLVKEVTASGSAYNILMEYDLLGNQTLLDDPNLGAIHYQCNVYGELLSQTDPLHTTTLEYDVLGRMTRRTSTEGTTTWVYDTGFIGNLSLVRGPGGISQSYLYDPYGRLETGIDTIQGVRYVTGHTYDSYGRENQLTYPSGFAVRHVYDTNGYLAEIRRVSDSQVLWVAQEANARGQLTRMLLGNGLVTEKTFNPNTGFVENIHTGSIQNMGFQWNARGNLLQRSNTLKSRTEDFTYDNLDRLATSTVNGYPTVSVNYDVLGNITSKSDVATGAFTYGLNAGPNALTRVNGNTGAISPVAQDIDYSSFNKVPRITEGNSEVRFTYGPEYARRIMERYENSILVSTKIYVGLYEKEVNGTDVKEFHYLNAGDGLFAIYTRVNQSGGSLAYVLKDHLGSIQCLTDESGALTEELSFDAWGRRRNPTTWQPLPMGGSYQTSLGFTSHEHIDIAALVNMEGRLYDPVVGRFLSADPFMQAPDYTQGLNRYSYCLNNPLSLIDPSGYSWLSRNWKSLAAGLVAITVTVVTAGTGATLGQAILSGALGGFSGGFTGALLNGGNIIDAFKAGVIGGVIGGLSAGAANKVGNFFGNVGKFDFAKELARSLAHGSLGGLTGLAQGGKFKHGFFSGMFASMAGSGMEASKWSVFQSDVGSVVTAAVVGGTASELGGGKFANGAVTGAYT